MEKIFLNVNILIKFKLAGSQSKQSAETQSVMFVLGSRLKAKTFPGPELKL